MLSRRLFVAALISFLLAVGPAGADEHGLDIDTPDDAIESFEGVDMFGGLFGDSDPLAKFKGRFIDSLDRKLLTRAPLSAPPKQSGLLLARREAFGRNMVPVPVADLERLGEAILVRLLDAAQITGFSPKLVIVAQDAINGVALPDGTIFVSLGAVRNIDNIHTFAALLAHEFSHVILNHYGSDWFMDFQQRGLAGIEIALAIRAQMKKSSGSGEDDKKLGDLKIKLIARAVVFASDVFLDSSWTRAQEDEADILAADLLVGAGFDLEGMSSLLEMMADQEVMRQEAMEKAEAERIHAFEQKIENRGLKSVFKSIAEIFDEGFRAMGEGLRESFGKDHRSAEERRELAVAYWDREYPNVSATAAAVDEWTTFRNRPATGILLDAYREVLNARTALSTQDLDGVVEKFNQALSVLPPTHSLPRIVAAELSAAAGDDLLAGWYFEQSLQARNPPLSAYVGYAEHLRKRRKSDAAAAILKTAMEQLGDPPQILPDLIAHLATMTGGTRKSSRRKINALILKCKIEALDSLFKMCAAARQGHHTRLASLSPDARLELALTRVASGIRVVTVVPRLINARQGPGAGFSVVRAFKKGVALMVIGTENKWHQVRDTSGAKSWVASWLTVNAPDARARFLPPDYAAKLARPTLRTPAHGTASSTRIIKRRAPTRNVKRSARQRLRELKTLRDEDLIDESEYRQKRQEILKEL